MAFSAAELGTTCNNLLISTSAFWKHFWSLRGIWFLIFVLKAGCHSVMIPQLSNVEICCERNYKNILLNWGLCRQWIDTSLCHIMTGCTKCGENSLTHSHIPFGDDCSHECLHLFDTSACDIQEKPIENNGESKYLIHLSSLLCLAVITIWERV